MVAKADRPFGVKGPRANADSKVALLHCRQACLQKSDVFECLPVKAHFSLIRAPLPGAWLPHRYVSETLIFYVVPLASVLVVCVRCKLL
jgi:hypothetical protein